MRVAPEAETNKDGRLGLCLRYILTSVRMLASGRAEGLLHLLLSLLGLVLYSTAVNSMCGHQSFWNIRAILQRLGHYTRYILTPSSTSEINTHKKMVTARPPGHTGVGFHALNQDVLSEVLLCLNIRDASACCCVNKSFRSVAHTPYIRAELLGRMLYGPLREYKRTAVSMLSQRPGFLSGYLHILYAVPRIAVRKQGEGWVIIDHSLYNLLEFSADHPGGDEILREYWGRDATRVYNLALHSRFARQLGRQYVAWAPPNGVMLLLKDYSSTCDPA